MSDYSAEASHLNPLYISSGQSKKAGLGSTILPSAPSKGREWKLSYKLELCLFVFTYACSCLALVYVNQQAGGKWVDHHRLGFISLALAFSILSTEVFRNFKKTVGNLKKGNRVIRNLFVFYFFVFLVGDGERGRATSCSSEEEIAPNNNCNSRSKRQAQWAVLHHDAHVCTERVGNRPWAWKAFGRVQRRKCKALKSPPFQFACHEVLVCKKVKRAQCIFWQKTFNFTTHLSSNTPPLSTGFATIRSIICPASRFWSRKIYTMRCGRCTG